MEENKTLIAEENLEENPIVMNEDEENSNVGLAIIAGSLVGIGAYFIIKKGVVPMARKAAIWFEKRRRENESSKNDADATMIDITNDVVETNDEQE